MITQPKSSRARSLVITLFGALLVTLGFTTYPLIAASEFAGKVVTEGFVVSYAYFALGLIIFGSCVFLYGATNTLTNWSTSQTSGTKSSISTTIASIFARHRYSRLLLTSSLAYGIFYAFASGVIVYQPAISFSETYHVAVPSLAIATCCGPIGETPEAVAYLTQHVGLLLIPINLLLLFSISWLVGVNVSLAAFSLSTRTKSVRLGWFGGMGAFIGLFTACPTCAGLAILVMFSGTGSLSAAFFLGPLQTLFVGLSVPILAATPIISARSLCKLEGRACAKP